MWRIWRGRFLRSLRSDYFLDAPRVTREEKTSLTEHDMTDLTAQLRDLWCDPYAQIRRAWNRSAGRVLLTVAVTSHHMIGEDIAGDELKFFASRGLRVAHVSERRDLRNGDRLFWVLAEPVT